MRMMYMYIEVSYIVAVFLLEIANQVVQRV